MPSPTKLAHEAVATLERQRVMARERMARRRAAIKAMPPHLQQELTERARASRAKYRDQHRVLLTQKERARRQRKSTHPLDEYIRRRRIRESRPSYQNYLRSKPTPPPHFE